MLCGQTLFVVSSVFSLLVRGWQNGKLNRKTRTIWKTEVKTPLVLIEEEGYPSEAHRVVTQDGYILELHRIPAGGTESDRAPVLLMHCIFCSSADWLLNYPEDALGFVLAKSGYDVWMLNARGNTFSRNHVSLSPNSRQFWNFSFHEIAVWDIPASIDYIINVTHSQSVHYIGYSMGVATLFAMLSERPEYNVKIKVAAMLGPATYLTNSKATPFKFSPFVTWIEVIANALGIGEVMTQNMLTNVLAATLCSRENFFFNDFCLRVFSIIIDIDQEFVNQNFLPIIFAHVPAGGSLKTLLHFMQVKNADRFQQYDYGKRHIHNPPLPLGDQPPCYNLSKTKIPVGLFFGKGDHYVSYKDVEKLASELPNLVLKHEIKHPKFSHFDFLWAKDAYDLLHKHVIRFLGNY